MLSKREKRDIVNRLNVILNDEKELKKLCNSLSNDIEKVIEKINQIIKYAFVRPNFAYIDMSLSSAVYSMKFNVDDEYKNFILENKQRLFSFLKKQTINQEEGRIKLEPDIRLSDLDGLKLPYKYRIEQLCDANLRDQKEQEEINRRKEAYYKEQRGFDETAFRYERTELVTINSGFVYYHRSLSGNVDKDFNTLYNDDRYGGVFKLTSPLTNSYGENIESIKRKNDIRLSKSGNVYEIENGRHRILYILRNGGELTIPVMVLRRIEDQEINIILNELKSIKEITILKNNVLNDEPNILIILDEKAYEIKDKEQLKEFSTALKSGDLSNFEEIPFNRTVKDKQKLINEYTRLIYQKYLEVGEEIITGNFTEVLKYFGGTINPVLYETYVMLQNYYNKSRILGQDFEEVLKVQGCKLEKDEKNSELIFE